MMTEIGTPSSHRITPRIDETFLSPRTEGCRESSEWSLEIASAGVLSCRKRTVASPQDHSPNAIVPAKFPPLLRASVRFEAYLGGGCLEPSPCGNVVNSSL
jgi:hypothetical protein